MNEVENECRFLGRLGKDPELQYLPSGSAIVKFGLAVDSTKKKGDEYEDGVTWVDLTAFGKLAERIHKLCKKGTMVSVIAKYEKNSYETKEGEKRTGHNFVVNFFKPLTGIRSKDERGDEDYDDGGASYSDEIPF